MTDAPADPPAPDRRAPTPWREITKWAFLGTFALLMLVLMDVRAFGGSPVNLIEAGARGPASAAIHHDFPDYHQPAGLGLDGQQYYAIARNPLHPTQVAKDLDNPRYRLQRPLLPWLAWALHPTGGGFGLIVALFLVTLAGTAGGAVAAGYLSWSLGGSPRLALLFPVLPGAWFSLRGSVSDALALALALGAICLATRSRHGWAVVLGALAVLAKEPAILVLGGWWLAHRTRKDLALVAIPALVIVAWMAGLHAMFPPDLSRSQDLALPFSGLRSAWQLVWSHGHEQFGMACSLGGLALGGLALGLRRLRHPLGWAIAVQLGFLLCNGLNPTAVSFGAARMTMPIIVLAGIALATPRATRGRRGAEPVAAAADRVLVPA